MLNQIIKFKKPLNRKLNILVFGITHERYEQQLCLTGHDFLVIEMEKKWNKKYGKIPENYFITDYIPTHFIPDLILIHVSDHRINHAHGIANKLNLPIIRHTHTLPQCQEEKSAFNPNDAHINTFISDYSMREWGVNGRVINHGLDTNFWAPTNNEKNGSVLSVVNFWASRDWACGWSIYQEIKNMLPEVKFRVLGDNPGLSSPSQSLEHLREELSSCSIFLNTSLHSPIPMSVLEAMSCGCAVVSTDTCMIPEIIKDGKNGLLAKNAKNLASDIEALLQNPQKVVELGNNARETIINDFNIDNFVNNWNNVFYEVIKICI